MMQYPGNISRMFWWACIRFTGDVCKNRDGTISLEPTEQGSCGAKNPSGLRRIQLFLPWWAEGWPIPRLQPGHVLLTLQGPWAGLTSRLRLGRSGTGLGLWEHP